MNAEDDGHFELDMIPPRDSVQCHFESATEYNELCYLLLAIFGIAVVLVWTSALSLCSSNYILHESKLDVLILSADIVSIDLFSCLFVLCGFTASFVYTSIGIDQWKILRNMLCWHCYAAGLCSNILAMCTSSVWRLYLGNFHVQDLALTLFEAFSSVRLLDVNQDPQHMHSLNLFSWPVLILTWCFLSVDLTWSGNKKLMTYLGHNGHYVISVLSLCGICLLYTSPSPRDATLSRMPSSA